MTFSLDSHWVWDFWFADDGDRFHMFYLHAPKSLGDPDLRHRNARIGRATSTDLVTWHDHGEVLTVGGPGDPDESATWTGSVVRGPDGLWRMFYTGSRFPDASNANIETILLATSPDLRAWSKVGGLMIGADPRWYEKLGDTSFPEEAWRDPWVFADPAGEGWHMLATARATTGPDARDRGVIAHATSTDLEHWTVQPPVSDPGAGFAHLEVPQVVEIDGRTALLFSCDTPALAGSRAASGERGGIWALEVASVTGPFDTAQAHLVVDDSLYAGRAVRHRDGRWVLLAFQNASEDGAFVGELSDPHPLGWSATGRLQIGTSGVAA